MKRYIFLFLFFYSCAKPADLSNWKDTVPTSFLKSQLQFPRVRDAVATKEIKLKEILTTSQIHSFEFDLFLRAFKQEEELEVWAKPKNEPSFRLIETYDFCRNSGSLGPKRKEGDYQIPEGFYRISHYNPKSNFLLSLKVNYPNNSDKILSDQQKPGSDIYIHGGCYTIGCIPITNDKIQELYLLSVFAKNDGEAVPIHIFPFRMTEQNLTTAMKDFSIHKQFWNQLKDGYDYFDEQKMIPRVDVKENGAYVVK